MTSSRWTRTTAGLAALVVGAGSLSACGFEGASDIPLPGGQGNGDDAYEVTLEFHDVLDLVPQSAVKVNDVTVGSVQSLEVEDFVARVVVGVNGDIELPANTRASLRQTSLLGEKFVSFDPPPAEQAMGRLRGGETIGLDRTTRSAEIEEVLGALSLVLNGGSLEQLQVINRELVAALEGREERVKSLLDELNLFLGGLDEQKAKIVRALDSLDRLSARLVGEREIIATALADIPPGLEVLTGQREEITEMLTSLDQLSEVATRVINATQANTVADLRALEPILTQLNEAGRALPESLELLTTYPFPRSVSEGIKGDYANLFVTLDIDTRGGNQGPPPAPLPPPPALPVPPPVAVPELPLPTPLPLPAIPGLPLPLPALPSLPPLPGTPPVPVPPAPAPQPSSGPLLPGLPLFNNSSPALLRLLLGGLR
jgi:phospholipid/cholesterol/gamma-HCH transport system substrate-binding protein